MSDKSQYANVFEAIHIRIITLPSDDVTVFTDMLQSFIGLSAKECSISLSSFTNTDELEQHILEASITKTRFCTMFAQDFRSKLSDVLVSQLLTELPTRVDEQSCFFVRFCLDTLVAKNELVLTDSGRCVHLKFSVSAFPRKREVALGIVENYLNTKVE